MNCPVIQQVGITIYSIKEKVAMKVCLLVDLPFIITVALHLGEGSNS